MEIIIKGLNRELVSSMYSENTRGTILREHSWIAGLSALTDMKESEELQTSRATTNVPLSEGDTIIVSGEQRAEKRTISRISAGFFMRLLCHLSMALSRSRQSEKSLKRNVLFPVRNLHDNSERLSSEKRGSEVGNEANKGGCCQRMHWYRQKNPEACQNTHPLFTEGLRILNFFPRRFPLPHMIIRLKR